MRLEHQKADLETKIGHLEADVAYLRSDYLFLNDGDKKDAIVGDSKTIHVSKSRPFWNK